MNYYKVVIKDGDDDFANRIYFSFYEIEEAINFAKKVLDTSDYDIEIIQCYEEENGEN